MNEHGERLPRGPKGDRGEPGQRGEQGMTRGMRRAVVTLFAIGALVAATALLVVAWSAHTQQRQQAAQQRAEQLQGRIAEQKICTTLGKLAALQPPAGNPATNPSRAFDQELHATLDQLGPDMGCGP
ncbi:MAG TPA: hypothetical protein VIZ43_10925 [Trebonia sp.]